MSASETEKEARRGKGTRGKGREGASREKGDKSDKGEKKKSEPLKDEAAAKEATFDLEAAPTPAQKANAEPESPWLAMAEKYAWVVVPALLPVAIVVGFLQGPQAVLLLLIGALLVGVIWLFWNSLRTMTGETPLTGADAYAIAAPRAEEEQKQAVLRALKDLEFERSVGKISDEDYAVLVARYRQEAKRLLRVLEEEARPRRESVEWLVQKRLAQAGFTTPKDSYRSGAGDHAAKADPAIEARRDAKKPKMKDAHKPVVPPRKIEDAEDEVAEAPKRDVDTTLRSEDASTKESPVYVPPTKLCASCGVKNDPDANFCKKCGSKDFEATKSSKDEGDPDEGAGAESDATDSETRDAEARS